MLHGLRVTGVTDAGSLADAVAVPIGDVAARLGRLAEEGLVEHRGRPPAGWGLTPSGRVEAGQLVSRELGATGARPAVASAYERFRALNPGVLDACSRWEVRDIAGVPVRNDHRDPDYDAGVIADLASLHRRAEPVCRDLAAALERYRPYGRRLTRALVRIEAGEGDWFTRPAIASYHTVWFQWHEDMLTTLDLDRTAERAAADAAEAVS